MTSSAADAPISVRLQNITTELRHIQDSLSGTDDIDPHILTDFRDAVNRVRNTAWAVEQYANAKATESGPEGVLSVLAGERVRVAYQLCRLVLGDLANPKMRFQKGQLLQLRETAQELASRIREVAGEP